MAEIAVFTSQTIAETGSSRYLLVMVQRLATTHHVHVVLPGPGSLADAVTACGATVHLLSFPRLQAKQLSWRLPGYVVCCALAMVRLWRLLRRHRIALVCFNDVIEAPWFPVARLSRCRALAYAQLILPDCWQRRAYAVWCGLWTDRVVCVSHALYCAMLAPTRVRTAWLRSPGPAEIFRNAPVSAPEDSTLRLVCVGAVVQAKGQDDAVRVVHALQQQHIRAQLTLVGDCPPGHEAFARYIRSLADELGVAEQITWRGKVQAAEISRELDHAHLLLHLPRCEDTLPNVCMEAAVRARPVVAWHRGGLGELVTSGVTGFLVTPGELTTCVERVLTLWRNRPLRERMGQAARDDIQTRFSPRHYDTDLQQLVAELLRQPGDTA